MTKIDKPALQSLSKDKIRIWNVKMILNLLCVQMETQEAQAFFQHMKYQQQNNISAYSKKHISQSETKQIKIESNHQKW